MERHAVWRGDLDDEKDDVKRIDAFEM